jgi:hypothetical protein
MSTSLLYHGWGFQAKGMFETQKEEIAMKTDAELQQHVMDELKWEPTIHAAEIGVAVKDGRAVAQITLASIIHSSYKHGNTN